MMSIWETFCRSLNFLDYNKTLVLTPPLNHNGLMFTTPHFSAVLFYHYPLAKWSVVYTLAFLFPKLSMIHEEEPLLILIVDPIAALHNKMAVKIQPLWAIEGISAGVASRTVENDHLSEHISTVFFPVHPGPPIGVPNHSHPSMINFFLSKSGTLNPTGVRSPYT